MNGRVGPRQLRAINRSLARMVRVQSYLAARAAEAEEKEETR